MFLPEELVLASKNETKMRVSDAKFAYALEILYYRNLDNMLTVRRTSHEFVPNDINFPWAKFIANFKRISTSI